MENTYFVQKLNDTTEELIALVNDTMRLGGVSFLEAFPATSYTVINIDGKLHRMKVEVTID